jgi:hypothetical protein
MTGLHAPRKTPPPPPLLRHQATHPAYFRPDVVAIQPMSAISSTSQNAKTVPPPRSPLARSPHGRSTRWHAAITSAMKPNGPHT